MMQLKKKIRDFEKPYFEVEIDPWTRYAPLEKEEGDKWKLMMKDESWVHPKVAKLIEVQAVYNEMKKGSKTGDLQYTGYKLVSIGGKTGGYKPPERRASQVIPVPLASLSK